MFFEKLFLLCKPSCNDKAACTKSIGFKICCPETYIIYLYVQFYGRQHDLVDHMACLFLLSNIKVIIALKTFLKKEIRNYHLFLFIIV